MKKKILALFLAMCMMISLLPQFTIFAAEAAPYRLVYDFINIDGYAKDNKLKQDIGFAQTDGTWAFHSWNGLDGDTVTYKPNYGIEIKSNSVGDYFAVKINVPYAGDYVPTLKYMELNTGDEGTYAKADVYILPEGSDIDTAPDSNKKIVAESLYFNKNGGKNTGSSKYDELAECTPGSSISLSAGEHILVFYLTETTTYRDYARMRPSKLTLTNGTPAGGDDYATVPMYMEISDATIEVGDGEKLKVSGWMNDGTAFTAGSDAVSFESKNGKVSIENGVATAEELGEEVITATVTSGGKSISKDLTVTVIPAVYSPPYQLKYDFKNIDGYVKDQKLTQDIGFAQTDGTWAFHSWNGLDGDTVTYKPNYGVEIKSDGVGDYFAVKINVPYEDDYIPSLTYYELDTKDDAKYVAADVYVLPKDSDVSTASESDKTVIAKNLYFCKNGGKNTDKDLGEYVSETPVTLSAGEHILVFYVTRCNGTLSAGNTRLRPGVLTLTSGTPETGEDYATVPMWLKVSDSEIDAGESKILSASGWLNDGTPFSAVSDVVSFKSKNGNVSIENGIATAELIGTDTVTATVSSGGKSLSKDISIAVVRPADAPTYQLMYDFTNADGLEDGGEITPDNAVYDTTKGTWSYLGASDSAVYKSDYIEADAKSVGSYFAVKVNVPYADAYTATVDYIENSISGDNTEIRGDVYLLSGDADIEDMQTAIQNNKICDIATNVVFGKSGGNEEEKTTEPEDIVLAAGEYVLVFYATNASDAKMLLKSFKLTSGTLGAGEDYAVVPMYISRATVDKSEIAIGETARLTVLGYMSDGSEFDAYSDAVSCIGEKGYVTVSGNTVTANYTGKETIAVSATVGKKTVTREVPITVKRTDEGVYELVCDFKKIDTFVNNALMDTSKVTYDTTAGAFEFHSSSGEDITYKNAYGIEIKTDETGDFFAVKINLKHEAEYFAVLNYYQYGTSFETVGGDTTADVYLVSKNTVDIKNPAKSEKIADIAKNVPFGTAGGANAVVSTEPAEITLPAGEHILVFKVTSALGNSSQKRIRPSKITLVSRMNPIAGMQTPTQALAVGDTIIITKDIVKWKDGYSAFAKDCTIEYKNKTPEIISLDENGVVVARKNGIGAIEVTAKWKEYELTVDYTIVVGSGKTRRSFYTEEKLKNLKNNIARYDWAQDARDSYVEKADKLLAHGVDTLYDMLTTQELPRASNIAYRFFDNGAHQCLYCEEELYAKYGDRPWRTNVFTHPWKIQCPGCQRRFPSNDFAKFYELGIDENGNYRFALALQRHHEKFVCKDGESCECPAPSGERGSEEWNTYYGYGVKGGYLYNDAFGEKNDPLFAVDDGWGYEFTYTYKKADGTPELNEDGSVKTELRCKPYIAWYNDWGLWYTEVKSWIENLSMAYLYTDDARYGRAAAVLVDRIADLYPDFDTLECGEKFLVNDGNTIKLQNGQIVGESRGKIVGNIHDCRFLKPIILAYDAVFPLLSDSEVISFLSEKAAEYNLDNPKTSSADIAFNIENGILREANMRIRDYRLRDNFGSPQTMHLYAAIVLDTFPETGEWIDFVFQSGGKQSIYEYTGGEVYSTLINTIDRDGHGTEAAPGYNYIWVENLMLIADAVSGYDKVASANLYENPKLIRVLTSLLDVEMVSNAAPNIGNHDRMGIHMSGIGLIALENLITIYNTIEDEETKANIARVIYRENGNTTEGLHGSIFAAEPEAVVDAIETAVADSMEIKLPSRMLSGYGLSILRDGDWFNSTDKLRNVNTQRVFYLWYGNSNGHGDPSKLTLGFYAYGLDVGADIGEVAIKDSSDPHATEMAKVTHSHNTVTVNNVSQALALDANVEHFEDSGRVKIMDAEAPEIYAEQGVEKYKRTIVSVDANDDISYAVDFFHVVGGEDHLYSFHALSKEAELSDNVAVQSQKDESGNYIGSYQGIDKKWGGSIEKGDGDGLGTYSWFGEVDRATDPAGVDIFSMDWKVVDNDKVLKPAQNNLRVRLTMLNSFKLDEITKTSGIPPQVRNALPKVPFLFARHTGENDGKAADAKLDTLFTSVVEPYNKDRYIESIEKVNVTRADGAEFTMDEAKAVKVTLTNGRVDYIVYAKDTTVPYKVHYSENESFDFCGYVGVVSMVDGKITYTYVNDGTTIADKTDLLPAYIGEVTGFQRDLSANNWMDVAFEGDVAPETLAGKYIYVDNGLTDNAAYLIESAEFSPETEGSIRLNLGNTTLIASYVDDYNFEKGYNYNIKVTDKARIPLSHVDDTAPTFVPIGNDVTATVGNSVKVQLKANSEHGAVTYSSVTLPRGASLDADTGAITWKPNASQIGENLVQVDAIDVYGRVARENFIITVYGSTTSKPSTDNDSEGSTDTPSGGGGGGGGGGGAAPAPDTDENVKPDDGETTNPDNGEDTTVGEGVPALPSKGFTDLTSHAWAADAINELAEKGIIKGTSETTFSPANNITRADFAILLVRAFGLSSDNTENFADVLDTDYFAKELAIARNCGIVGGIGDNKYAPRNTITRQDMMVIVYRALSSTLVGEGLRALPLTDEVSYPDFDTVADYAKEAVAFLISEDLVNGKNGLIDPTSYTTRAEVAVLIKRILDYTAK